MQGGVNSDGRRDCTGKVIFFFCKKVSCRPLPRQQRASRWRLKKNRGFWFPSPDVPCEGPGHPLSRLRGWGQVLALPCPGPSRGHCEPWCSWLGNGTSVHARAGPPWPVWGWGWDYGQSPGPSLGAQPGQGGAGGSARVPVPHAMRTSHHMKVAGVPCPPS